MNPEKIPSSPSAEEKKEESFDPITAAQEQEMNSQYQPWQEATKPAPKEEEADFEEEKI